MKRQKVYTFIALAAILIFAAAEASYVQADTATTTDAIAGTWYGNMHFSSVKIVQRIKLIILSGCESGSVCGSLLNYAEQCTWEITYDGFSGNAYQYHFSSTLKGSCPAGTAGSLTLLPDGTMYRFHTTPFFTTAGILSQLPNADK